KNCHLNQWLPDEQLYSTNPENITSTPVVGNLYKSYPIQPLKKYKPFNLNHLNTIDEDDYDGDSTMDPGFLNKMEPPGYLNKMEQLFLNNKMKPPGFLNKMEPLSLNNKKNSTHEKENHVTSIAI